MLGLVSIVLLNFAFCSVVQAAPAVVSVSPSSIAEVSQGDTFTIEIMVDPKGEEIYGAQYDLYFDSTILNVVSQTNGTFLSQDGAKTNVFVNETNNTIGVIQYGEAGIGAEKGVSSPGILASISFEATATSGKSDLQLSTVKVSDINAKGIETEINDGVCIIGKVAGEPAFTDIKVEEAHEMMGANPEEIILLDVRTEDEHKAEHIYVGGVKRKHIPLSELESRVGELDKTKTIIVYSKTGSRSSTAGEILVKQGFEDVYNLLGGINAWRKNFREDIIKATPSPAPTVAASPMHETAPTSIPEDIPIPTSRETQISEEPSRSTQEALEILETQKESTTEEISASQISTDTFTLIDIQQNKHTLTVSNQKMAFHNVDQSIVIINFFTTWCAPCRGQIPSLSDLQEKYKEEILKLVAELGIGKEFVDHVLNFLTFPHVSFNKY